MELKNKIKQYWKTSSEFILSSILFYFSIKYIGVEPKSTTEIIGVSLLFIIILQIIRTILEFALDSSHTIKIILLYNIGIIYSIMELIIATKKSQYNLSDGVSYIVLMSSLLILFSLLRYMDVKLKTSNF